MHHGHSLSVGDKLFGQTTMVSGQSAVIKQTYLLLSLSVLSAIAGAFAGVELGLWKLFTGILGWIVAIVLLNVIPMIAMACRHNPVLGIGGLILDGALAGLIISPMIYMASYHMGQAGHQAIFDASVITGLVFAGVTAYIMTTKRTFSAPRGLMAGLFFGVIGIVVLNIFMGSPLITLLVGGAIAVLGTFMLVFSTSSVLNNPEADSPIPGALMLFSGIFNVFVGVLSVLMSLGGDD